MPRRKTIDVSVIVDMGNRILSDNTFTEYDREFVSAFVESIIEKTGNKFSYDIIGDTEYSRKYYINN